MDQVARAFAYALRRMRKHPIFAGVVILSLALGIGVNSAVFTLVNAALLRPLPVENPERLLRVYTESRTSDSQFRAFSYPDYEDLRRSDAFSDVIAERFVPVGLSRDGRPELVWGELVSGNYFQALGIEAHVGRVLQPSDARFAGEGTVAVLGHDLWQRRFGGDRELIGQNITLNDRSFTVVGVAPPRFSGTFIGGHSELWVPITMQQVIMPVGDRLETRGSRWLTVTARMAPGVSETQAAAVLDALADQLSSTYPRTNQDVSIHSVPFVNDTLPFQSKELVTRISLLLLFVTLVVLLVACVNLGNLMLAQASGRQKEFAIRQVLGASRKQLVSQFLTESVVLAIYAGGLALLLTYWLGRLLELVPLPASLPFKFSVGIDVRVALFTFLLALAVGFFLGLLPASGVSRLGLASTLRSEAGGGQYHGLRLRSLLIVGQVALCVVLLVGAGLFVRSLRNLVQVDPGFESDRVLLAATNVALQGYENPKGFSFYRQTLERIEALGEVERASLAEIVPLELGGQQQIEAILAGREVDIDYNLVSPGYFETLGIPLLRGRDFDYPDGQFVERSVIVNQTMAELYWQGEDPVGQRFTVGGGPAHVVGVAQDIRFRNLTEEPGPFLYLAFGEGYEPAMTFHVKTRGNPGRVLQAMRRTVAEADPDLPLYNVSTLGEHLDQVALPARLGASLLSGFGLIGLLLAAVGTYAVIAFSVARRWRELGVRLALGAQPGSLMATVFWRGMRLVLVGVGAGLVVAWLTTRTLSVLLYGVSGSDPLTFVLSTFVLVLVASLALLLPTRRAARVDLRAALTSE